MATATLLTSGRLGWNDTNAASFTTASITPGADCALVLLVGLVMAVNGATTPFGSSVVPTSSGSGPTWTQQSGSGAAIYTAGAGVFTAVIGGTSPGSFTVSFNPTGVDNMGAYAYALYRVTGHDTGTTFGGKISTTGNAGDGAVTATLDAAPASADITLALNVCDTDTGDGGATFSSTYGTWTEDGDGDGSGHTVGYNFGQRTGSTATQVDWSDVNVGTADNYSSGQAAIVVKAGASGQSITPSGASISATAGTLTVTTTVAISPVGASVSATAGSVTVTGSTVPSAVSDLAGTAGNAQVVLTWSAPSDGGSAITDYIVEYREA